MENKKMEELKASALNSIKNSKDLKSLEEIRVKFLGRKDGEITRILRSLKDLSIEEKRKIGPLANALQKEIEETLNEKLKQLTTYNLQLTTGIDLTMPGKKVSSGHLHPLTIIEKEIREIFKAMNFSVVDGPEVESEFYNFDALNIPKNHPARDAWDTFWLRQNESKVESKKLKERLLLRTHTSPVQIRYMEQHKPPFQIIVPGRVFRYEATDASHETNFHQVEGLMVGKNITLANFKFVIQEFFSRLFKKNVKIRLRPSYFPFVEPGLEVDVECIKCSMRMPEQSSIRKAHANESCSVCKGTGWLEIMGAGMVHPKVFEAVHYNPRDWQGFAFGLGLERVAMIKYNIPDIRLFCSGDLRFIKQF
ncbi:MAG: phenylalanine--tRNA ligase subunit alpha [Patescibacteria group bacterium]